MGRLSREAHGGVGGGRGLIRGAHWGQGGHWVGSLGWVIGLAHWVGSLGWLIGLGHWVGSLGWVIGLAHWAGSLGWLIGLAGGSPSWAASAAQVHAVAESADLIDELGLVGDDDEIRMHLTRRAPSVHRWNAR